jgi:hypothetical protein
MTVELRARLAAVPVVEIPLGEELERRIEATLAWLDSDDALRFVHDDPYWPKWYGPWWAMLALHELGQSDRIPQRIVGAMVDALNALPVHTFPIREEEWPPGVDRRRHSLCHCGLASIDQVLAACGVNVDRALPWVVPWFTRYQMPDGGYNCDEGAYLAAGECASSMVGTIAPFEAMVRRGPSAECDRAAAMLIGRRLVEGSSTRYNAAEREAARAWTEPCFPRFYFYDVLRGAAALVRWAVAHQRTLPRAAIQQAIEHLLDRAGTGVVRIGRVAWQDKTTWIADDGWTARHPARPSELIELCGRLGEPNGALTAQWGRLRRDLIELIDGGRLLP